MGRGEGDCKREESMDERRKTNVFGKKGPDRRMVLGGMVALGAMGYASLGRANTAGVTGDTIRIGTMMGLTGSTAIASQQMLGGIQAYVGMVNDRGGVNGRKLELIAEDNEYSAQRSVTAIRKMTLRDGIFALVGANGAGQINAVLDLLEQQGVPMINAYTSLLAWVEPPKKNIYGVYVPHEYNMAAVGRAAAKDGHKKISVPYLDLAWNDALTQKIEPAVKLVDPNATVERLPIKAGTVDYVPIVLEIMKQKPDAIVACNIVGEFVSLVRELDKQGAKIPIYTGPWNLYDSIPQLAPKAMEGIRGYALTTSPLVDEPAIKEYRDAMDKFVTPKQEYDFISLFNFGAMKIFVEALSRIEGEPTHEALYAALDGMKDYESGIFPPVTFGPDDHQGSTSLFEVVVKDGHWTPTGTVIDASKTDW